ncbi:MAG TPA: sulfur oxidation c-type cytochrome SoxA [Burkholderiales bacterium]
MFFPLVVLGEIPLSERKSGYEFMSRETKAMQDDEVTGPAVLTLLDGEALWGKLGCQGCHKDAAASMKGAAARYPAMVGGKLTTLEQQVRHRNPELRYESRELLALTAFVAKHSRGMPIEASGGKPNVEAGRAFFHQRQGQLNLACASCHDDNWGKKLGGTPIPQAHPTGYPIYRLEWQGVGSFTRRLRNCLTGMRAELLPHGAPELVDLEAYLMWRARGMKMEAPAVRP